MIYLQRHQKDILDIVTVCGLPHKARKPFLAFLQRLECNHGAAFVVKTLKERASALKSNDLKRFKTHTDGTWRGVWRPLSRLSSRKKLRAALRILRLGDLFIAPRPQKEQYIAVAKELAKPSTQTKFVFPWISSRAKEEAERLTRNTHYVPQSYPLSLRTVALAYNYSKREYYCTPEDHIRVLDNCPRLVLKHYRLLSRVVGEGLLPEGYYRDLIPHIRSDVVGRVTLLTKDGGMKYRTIANPHRLLQLALSRLKRALRKYLSAQPWYFVGKDALAIDTITGWLKQGRRVFSVDLKAASDNIPLELQIQWLTEMFPQLDAEIQLFGDMQRCDWWTPYKDVLIRWLRGQGCGTDGSFDSFCGTLGQIVILAKVDPLAFALYGDDLAHCAVDQHAYLVQLLGEYGIPINLTKSLVNQPIAEFVGKVLDKHGSLEVYKASRLSLKNDPLGFIRQYGPKALTRTRLKEKLKAHEAEELLCFITLSNDPVFRKWLSAFAVNSKDKSLLEPESIDVPAVGGIPIHLLKSILESIPDPECEVINTRGRTEPLGSWDVLSKDESDFARQLLANQALQGKVSFSQRKPAFTVALWQFTHNHPEHVQAIRVGRDLISSGEKFSQTPAFSALMNYARDVHDLEQIDRDAASLRKEFTKSGGQRRTDRITPFRYIKGVVRAASRALQVVRTLF